MTALEIISTIKNLKAGGKPSDDTSMSDYQWMFIIDYYRAMLIRQQQTNRQTISEFIQQEVPCSLILSDMDDELFESKEVLPKPIEVQRIDLITHVGNDDEIGYQRQTFNNYQWRKYSKYSKSLPFYFIKGGKLLVGGNGGNKNVLVRGVFENPIEVERLSDSYSELNPFDFNYPLSNNMIDSIIKLISDAEMKVLHMIPKDNVNDSQDLP
jgi:hypothetical protein